MATFETERLSLRPWQEKDAEILFKYASDPEIGPLCGWQPHKSVEESLFTITNFLNGKECYAVCLKGSDEPIGSCELKLNGHSNLFDSDDESEIGYWLGRPFWGKGYMTEIVKALEERAFTTRQMKQIWCCYHDGNERSKRVQEKSGFVYQRSTYELNSNILIHVNLLTKEDWEKSK